jgi:hypothetical protein
MQKDYYQKNICKKYCSNIQSIDSKLRHWMSIQYLKPISVLIQCKHTSYPKAEVETFLVIRDISIDLTVE